MQVKSKGKIITVTSTKGGVGKTINILNLAGVYSLLDKKVLIIDLDIYGGDIATYVNSNVEKSIFNLVDDFTYNRYRNINDYIFNYNENISIISSPKDPRLANKIDAKYIPIILDNVVYKYDVILIDTCHTLNKINIITLDNSDVILYMFTNDSFDLKNTKTFMSIIKDTGMDNVYTLLNESIYLDKTYFSMYEIRNIIKDNVDFTIPKSFHVRTLDKYIMDGVILTLNPNIFSTKTKDGSNFVMMAEKLLQTKEGEK